MSEQGEVRREKPAPHQAPKAEALLRQALEVVENARQVPLSSDSRINKDELLELLNEVLGRLPDELRAARWLLKEREEFLAKTRREGDEILELARVRAARMVERTEVVRAAESRARHILDTAEAEARRMQREVEDFCDRKLGSFEVVLQKTLKVVSTGRARMQGVGRPQIAGTREAIAASEDATGVLFDQDLS
jgi:cell division septum initiation protein DivIVA